jgi:hypothetical protein
VSSDAARFTDILEAIDAIRAHLRRSALSDDLISDAVRATDRDRRGGQGAAGRRCDRRIGDSVARCRREAPCS